MTTITTGATNTTTGKIRLPALFFQRRMRYPFAV